MPNQFRVEMVYQSLERDEFSPEQSMVLLGMIGSLESGDTLLEVVQSLEAKFHSAADVLETIDLASSWIRSRQEELSILL